MQPIEHNPIKDTWVSHDGSVTILTGDNRETLKSLPDNSVHCIVTSPPYYGLRDYGTQQWDGGDMGCDHIARHSKHGGVRADRDQSSQVFYASDICAKCGAKRIDSQIGLEETPEKYVAELVNLFRECRRVLRDDGVFWLNLGQSYASGGTNPNQSPLLKRVPACGNDGRELLNSLISGRACPDFDDGRQDANPTHHVDIAHIAQSSPPTGQQTSRIVRDTERQDSGQASPAASLPDAPVSTLAESSSQLPDASCLSATALASPLSLETSCLSSLASEHTTACTDGTSPIPQILAVRKKGKELFFSACGSPDCNGVGRCGLCWCKLCIPSLNIKAQDEINTPHLVAMALQADGWVLRQTIIWQKPNPMPESVQNRCTKAHEYIFLLSKSARYYYDAEAVKESSETAFTRERDRPNGLGTDDEKAGEYGFTSCGISATRNKRSVWTVTTKPYSEAHFATFPPDLIKPCILAGCPEKVCGKCGAPYVRDVERTPATSTKCPKTDATYQAQGGNGEKKTGTIGMSGGGRIDGHTVTLGFSPSCDCQAEPSHGVTLDPFGGSGTTAYVSLKAGRNAVLCELNPEYVELTKKRIQAELAQGKLF